MNSDSRLNPQTRRANLRALENSGAETPLDVLIIGGGVTGAGAALDAATRGLRVGLVEAGDFGRGASSTSSRLAHGGLRYLEQGQIRLVAEALRERRLLVEQIAPTLAHRLEFILPARNVWQLLYMRFGVAVYDLLAIAFGGRLKGARSRLIGRKKLAQVAPSLNAEMFTGAVLFSDAQIDDALHTVAVIKTAQAHGALVAHHATAAGVRPTDDSTLSVAIDADGRRFQVHAKTVLFACGAWTNLWSMDIMNSAVVQPSKGTHLAVPRDAIALDAALISRTERSVLFVLPWNDTWIIGTTDEEYTGDPEALHVTQGERDYLLDQVNDILKSPLAATDVVGAYAGLRPLPAEQTTDTTNISREHRVIELDSRVFAVIGGKYTTYRKMAKDAIDLIAPFISGSTPPSITHRIRLRGPSVEGSPPPHVANRPLQFTHGRNEGDVWRAIMLDGAQSAIDVLVRRWRVIQPSPQQLDEVETVITTLSGLPDR